MPEQHAPVDATSTPARPALAGADPEALARGRVTDARVRRPPAVGSWALKVVMALTGILLMLFVLAHMVGNLKMFTGAEHLNAYALWLRTALEPVLPHEGLLWILRVVLLASVLAHVAAAAVLAGRSARSRGPARGARTPRRGWRSFTARTMPVSGVLLGLFVVFHLLDLTTGTAVASAEFRHAGDEQAFAYENVVASFSRPWVAAAYAAAMLVLLAHLVHGLWTAVQDLGVTGHRARAVGLALSGVLPVVIVVGNLTIPVAVVTGVLE